MEVMRHLYGFVSFRDARTSPGQCYCYVRVFQYDPDPPKGRADGVQRDAEKAWGGAGVCDVPV